MLQCRRALEPSQTVSIAAEGVEHIPHEIIGKNAAVHAVKQADDPVVQNRHIHETARPFLRPVDIARQFIVEDVLSLQVQAADRLRGSVLEIPCGKYGIGHKEEAVRIHSHVAVLGRNEGLHLRVLRIGGNDFPDIVRPVKTDGRGSHVALEFSLCGKLDQPAVYARGLHIESPAGRGGDLLRLEFRSLVINGTVRLFDGHAQVQLPVQAQDSPVAGVTDKEISRFVRKDILRAGKAPALSLPDLANQHRGVFLQPQFQHAVVAGVAEVQLVAPDIESGCRLQLPSAQLRRIDAVEGLIGRGAGHGIVLQIIAVRVALLLPQRGGRQNQERQQRQQAQCGGDVSFHRPHRAHLTPSGRSWPWFP